MDETKQTRGPKHKDRVGRVHVSLWQNETKGGDTFETFVIERRYPAGEDADGNTLFKSSNSFPTRDLDSVEEAVRKLRAYIAGKAA